MRARDGHPLNASGPRWVHVRPRYGSRGSDSESSGPTPASATPVECLLSTGRALDEDLGEPLEDAFCCSYRMLVAWIAARTRDWALAEDIADDAFERLLITTRAGRRPAHQVAWLRRVALNLIISRARRADVAARRMGCLLPPAPRWDPTLDEVLDRERWSALLAAFEVLPPSHRTILLLAARGSGAGQMAAELGIRPGAARTRLHRARRALRCSEPGEGSRTARAPSGPRRTSVVRVPA
jgi:RNA polymerase sigma factor (sigma-70 family)